MQQFTCEQLLAAKKHSSDQTHPALDIPENGISMACSSTCQIDDVTSQQHLMKAEYTGLIIAG